MKAHFYSIIFCFFVLSHFSHSQEEGLYYDYDGLMDKIQIENIPTAGTFVTVQIAAFVGESYDRDFMSSFILLKPVFVTRNNDWNFISLGIFNSIQQAKILQARVATLFPGAFPVAYVNGRPIDIDDFTMGDNRPRAVDVEGVTRRLNQLISTAYYRVRTGYYVQDGLEKSEAKMYKKLGKNGITFIQEPFQNGRIYVTEQTFANLWDAVEMRSRIEGITEKEAVVQYYFENIGIELHYLKEMFEALSNP
jgi:hypothetical protein